MTGLCSLSITSLNLSTSTQTLTQLQLQQHQQQQQQHSSISSLLATVRLITALTCIICQFAVQSRDSTLPFCRRLIAQAAQSTTASLWRQMLRRTKPEFSFVYVATVVFRKAFKRSTLSIHLVLSIRSVSCIRTSDSV
ncbi:hypothetical protein ACLKA7_002959 [Drosophila subpalustris]